MKMAARREFDEERGALLRSSSSDHHRGSSSSSSSSSTPIPRRQTLAPYCGKRSLLLCAAAALLILVALRSVQLRHCVEYAGRGDCARWSPLSPQLRHSVGDGLHLAGAQRGDEALNELRRPRSLAALRHFVTSATGGENERDAALLERVERIDPAAMALYSGFTPPWARTPAWRAASKADVASCYERIAKDPLYPADPWIQGAEPHWDAARGRCDCSRPVARYGDCALDDATSAAWSSAKSAKRGDGELRVTVVTALLNIGRKGRTLCDYVRYMEYILRWDVNLVIFVEAEAAPLVTRLRNRTPRLLKERTVIHAVDPNDRGALLAFVELLPRMREAIDAWFLEHALRGFASGRGEHSYAEYAWINHAKVGMLQRAMRDNTFNSDYFYWTDAGFGHYEAMAKGGFEPALRPHFCPCNAALPKKVTMFCLGWAAPRLRADFGGLKGYVEGKGWLGGVNADRHWEACRGDMWGGGAEGVTKCVFVPRGEEREREKAKESTGLFPSPLCLSPLFSYKIPTVFFFSPPTFLPSTPPQLHSLVQQDAARLAGQRYRR
jgi:hypothetical protein